MLNFRNMATKKRFLSAAALLSLGLMAGCDDRVQITRDRDVRIPTHATWAWRPAVEEVPQAREPHGDRPVISRDMPARNERAEEVRRDPDANNEIVRGRVKTAIEQTLASKGFKQVDDPAAADFLVDYKFGVERRNARVPVAYGGAYPGLVCGPFRCWESWGYGPAYVGYENVHFREGTIVFDWVQQSTRHNVYRAIGEKPVHRDAFSLRQSEINDLVHHLLKDLKPGK